jgi:hypothetical protein
MHRRAFLLASALALPGAIALTPRSDAPLAVADANATVAVLLTVEELVNGSAHVVVGTPGERYSAWEELPSGRRIVTYTKLTVERAVTGAPGGEVWVRTLGGAVGKIGQSVAGEAQLQIGKRSLVFLASAGNALVVTGMAQGHFPIVADDKGVPRLAGSPDPGLLLARRGPSISAQERLVGGKLDDAAALVQQIRRASDAKK